MLFDRIVQLERKILSFNQKTYDFSNLERLCTGLKINLLPDTTIKYAVSFQYYGKKFIYYNPHLSPLTTRICLGHEIGHWLLGHIEYGQMCFSPESLFTPDRIEREASIISFLLWHPTPYIEWMLESGQNVSAEDLFNFLRTYDEEEALLIKLCEARMRVFRAYRRVLRELKGGWNIVPMPMKQ